MRAPTVLASALAALALAGAAAATAPRTETSVRTGSWAIDCGGFSLIETFSVAERDTLFVAADGTALRAILHFDYDGVITNAATGNTFREPGHFEIAVDFAGTPLDGGDDTIAVVGEVFQIIVPGLGSVLQDTGRLLGLPETVRDSIAIEQLDPGSFNLVYGRLREAVRTVVVAGPHEAFHAERVDAILCGALR